MELEINNETKIIFERKLILWLYIGKKLMDAPRESINFEIVEESYKGNQFLPVLFRC